LTSDLVIEAISARGARATASLIAGSEDTPAALRGSPFAGYRFAIFLPDDEARFLAAHRR
jgi:hypothetical protein